MSDNIEQPDWQRIYAGQALQGLMTRNMSSALACEMAEEAGVRLAGKMSRLEDVSAELVRAKAAMQEFCDRVDRGEVRSAYTYNKFKDLLGE